MAESLIKYKGIADILVAAILVFKPSLIYGSLPARVLASKTGLHLSRADAAPGFNQAIACMVAAVGVGQIVASRCGPVASPPVFAMNLTWAILGFLSCVTPRAWGLGSATLLLTSFTHTAFSITLYAIDG